MYIYRVLTDDVDFPGFLHEQSRHVRIFGPAGDRFPVILHSRLELHHAHRSVLRSLLLRVTVSFVKLRKRYAFRRYHWDWKVHVRVLRDTEIVGFEFHT